MLEKKLKWNGSTVSMVYEFMSQCLRSSASAPWLQLIITARSCFCLIFFQSFSHSYNFLLLPACNIFSISTFWYQTCSLILIHHDPDRAVTKDEWMNCLNTSRDATLTRMWSSFVLLSQSNHIWRSSQGFFFLSSPGFCFFSPVMMHKSRLKQAACEPFCQDFITQCASYYICICI